MLLKCQIHKAVRDDCFVFSAMHVDDEAEALFNIHDAAGASPCKGEAASRGSMSGFGISQQRFCKSNINSTRTFGATAVVLPDDSLVCGKQVWWHLRDFFYNLQHGESAELCVWLRSGVSYIWGCAFFCV